MEWCGMKKGNLTLPLSRDSFALRSDARRSARSLAQSTEVEGAGWRRTVRGPRSVDRGARSVATATSG